MDQWYQNGEIVESGLFLEYFGHSFGRRLKAASG